MMVSRFYVEGSAYEGGPPVILTATGVVGQYRRPDPPNFAGVTDRARGGQP